MYAEQLLLWLDQDERLGPLGTTGPVDIVMDPCCYADGYWVTGSVDEGLYCFDEGPSC